MNRYKETHDTWNKVAKLYQEKFMDLDLYNDSYDFFCAAIKKPAAKILDIGCGPGNITKYLLAKRPQFHVFGIDIAPNMIALAIQNNPTANFAVMDSRQIESLQHKYDAIVCGFCLPYLSHTDSSKFVADCYRLLQDGGLIYLSFVEGNPAMSGFKVASTGDRSYFYYYDVTQVRSLLGAVGFDIVRVFTVKYQRSATETEWHTIMIAFKKYDFEKFT